MKFSRLVWLTVLGLIASQELPGTDRAHGSITIQVVPSLAPVAPGSPSWLTYASQAVGSLATHGSLGIADPARNVGSRLVTPTAYEVSGPGPLDPAELMVTAFHSWRGQAPPTPLWDGNLGQFAAEFGNRLHFGLRAVGDGVSRFRLADLTYELTSNDGGSFNDSGDFLGVPYSDRIVGIDWVDGISGNGNDIVYNSSATTLGTELIDELIYVGVGTGFEVVPTGLGNLQAEIDAVRAKCDCSIDITASYTLRDHRGSTTVTIVPEPSAMLGGVWGMLAWGIARRRGLGIASRKAGLET